MKNLIKLLHGDSLTMLKTLPADSIHCCMTSPPYWGGLRDYGVDGQLGMEALPSKHIEKMVAIAKEVYRVLHPSGLFFMNYGDCYATGAGSARIAGGDRFGKKNQLVEDDVIPMNQPNRMKLPGLKPKDMIGMPWELALAFRNQAGFYLRTDVIWHKTNALTTSAQDRFPTTHEYLFMFSKSERYFFDEDATREITGKESTWEEYAAADGRMIFHEDDKRAGMLQTKNKDFKVLTHPLGARKRTVWAIPTEPVDFKKYGDFKHFATFPKALVDPCIKSGTASHGCCSKCLQPYRKTFEIIEAQIDRGLRARADAPGSVLSEKSSLRTGRIKAKKPIGWEPDCSCVAKRIPCTVLDIFCGSGTTGIVASRLQRSFIGIELDSRSVELSRLRISEDQPLFNEIEVVA